MNNYQNLLLKTTVPIFSTSRQFETNQNYFKMNQKALIGAASRYIAGRNAVQTVYWRSTPTASGEQAKILKVSKTCAFGKTTSAPSHIKQEHKLRY